MTKELEKEFWEARDEAYLSTKIIAAGTKKSVSTLNQMAQHKCTDECRAPCKQCGPKFIKSGNRRMYRKPDVLAWMEPEKTIEKKQVVDEWVSAVPVIVKTDSRELDRANKELARVTKQLETVSTRLLEIHDLADQISTNPCTTVARPAGADFFMLQAMFRQLLMVIKNGSEEL